MKYQLAEVLGFLCHTTDTTTVADAIEVIDGPDYPNWEDLPQNLDEFSETQIGSAYQDNWDNDTAESFEVPLRQLATENDQYSLDELDEIMEELVSHQDCFDPDVAEIAKQRLNEQTRSE